MIWFAAVGGYTIYALPTADSLAAVYSGEKWCDDHPPASDNEAAKCAVAADEHAKFLSVAQDEVGGARLVMLGESFAAWLLPALVLYIMGIFGNWAARRLN